MCSSRSCLQIYFYNTFGHYEMVTIFYFTRIYRHHHLALALSKLDIFIYHLIDGHNKVGMIKY